MACRYRIILVLSKTLQRYENKSKSQLRTIVWHAQANCLRLCKDTKIKANHNHDSHGVEKDNTV